jgi:hypothetical protein
VLFIAAALASDADSLITGDKDLLEEQPLSSTQIVRPAAVDRADGGEPLASAVPTETAPEISARVYEKSLAAN